jgi:hypothetical protein
MISMLLKIWQLPQNLLGLLLVKVLRAEMFERIDDVVVYKTKYNIGISLGDYIIVRQGTSIKHEYGHSKQSKILGWFYLIVVGLPSITFNILTRMGILKREDYYTRFPENWADSLGDVDR